MNSIVIVGRAVRDAEVRYSTGEKSTAYGNYTLAVDRPYKKTEKKKQILSCAKWLERPLNLQKSTLQKA